MDRDAAPGGGGGGDGDQLYAIEFTANETSLAAPCKINDWAGNPLVGNGARTVEFWVNDLQFDWSNLLTAGEDLTHKAYFIQTKNGDQIILSYWVNDIVYDSVGAFTDAWHHFAVTWDGTDEHVYLDGVEFAVDAGVARAAANTTKSDIHILEYYSNGGKTRGKIFDVRIWSVERTAQQIAENYLAQLEGDESGLEAYYPMNEGSGTPIDKTGNSTFTITIGNSANGPNWAEITDPRPPAITQVWALRHDGTEASAVGQDEMTIADWAGNPFVTDDPWTIEFWTRAQQLPPISNPLWQVGSAAGEDLYQEGSGGANIGFDWDGTTKSTPFWNTADDYNGTNWIHLAMTYDPGAGTYGTFYFYRNGVQQFVQAKLHVVDLQTDVIRILGTKNTNWRLQMDVFDVRIWDVYRTPAEIAANYRRSVSSAEPGLVANFLLNDDAEGNAPVDATSTTTAVLDQTHSALSWVAITDPR